jgi:hypothetical protein
MLSALACERQCAALRRLINGDARRTSPKGAASLAAYAPSPRSVTRIGGPFSAERPDDHTQLPTPRAHEGVRGDPLDSLPQPTAIQHVGAQHRRSKVALAKQLLNAGRGTTAPIALERPTPLCQFGIKMERECPALSCPKNAALCSHSTALAGAEAVSWAGDGSLMV